MPSRPERSPLVLGSRIVGRGQPCLVIAEAGVNHDGDVELAHRLIAIAAEAGADAVKFQTFRPENLVSRSGAAAPYQERRGSRTQRSMLEELALPESAWAELAADAAERGLVFLSTAFDIASAGLLVALGVAALKVPSGELDNLPFLTRLAGYGLPLIVSTGMATLKEVADAVEATSTAPALALLHCVTAYPAPVESSNLRAIGTLAERFGTPVGWSDHTEGNVTAVAAVTLGASILEKHFTSDRRRRGPDHAASAEPHELANYIAAVRAVEASLGDGVKRPAEIERENLPFARRSYHAARDLGAGKRVGASDVELLRPATGLAPRAQVVGRVLRRPVAAGQPLVAEDLQ